MLKLRTDKLPSLLFFLFCSLHLLVWTLAPTLIRFNLPMDAIEGSIWGKHLAWGYDKNPFISALVTKGAIYLGNYADWGIYFVSQLAIIICFWAIFTLGKKILPANYALMGVLLLEGMQYYNLHAIDLSDNALELPTWSLTILFCYLALTENKLTCWLFLGFFAGLALMTKYYSLILIITLLLFILIHKNTRSYLYHFHFHLALFITVAIITPHVIWLYHHQGITIHYALTRLESKSHGLNHIFYPLQFAWQQFEVLIPTIILYATLFLFRKPSLLHKELTITPFSRQFIIFVSIVPLLLTLLVALITGFQLRAAWGMPLFSLWGLLLIIFYPPSPLYTKNIVCFFLFILVFIFINIAGYYFFLTRAKETSSALYPGKWVAATVTEEWHRRYHTPLSYVMGSRWTAGNVGFYSKDHPEVFIKANKDINPWIDENDLTIKGGVIILEKYDKETTNLSPFNLSELQYRKVPWQRNQTLPYLHFTIIWLPPFSAKP